MKAVKLLFKLLAGLWLLVGIILALGNAWLRHSTNAAVDAVEDTSEWDSFGLPRMSDAERERMRAQTRAAEKGWGADQSLPEEASIKSGGWAD